MARRNPYAMDPNLARGISNLTRALIGSAADDAALARGRASDALARKYDSETEGQGIKNRRATDLSAAIAEASDPNGVLAQSILESQGLQLGEFGGVIQKVMPDGPQWSVPMNANQRNVSSADQLKNVGGLTRAFFGDGTYNPTQFAGGLQSIQNTIARNLATTLAQGSDDQRRQAMTLMGKSPGQYFDSGVAQRGQDLTDATARRGQDIDSNDKRRGQDVTATTARRGQDVTATTARRGQDIDSTDKRRGQDIDSADKRRGQDITDTTNRRGQDLDSADKRRGQDIDDKTTRWKHNNRTVSMTVEPGKQIVLDPQTGRMLGIEPTMVTDGGETKEMYVLDGGPAPGKIKVSVPQGGTVFMDKTTADAIGVKKDKNGQYKVVGQPKSKTSSGKNSGLKVSTTEAKKYQEIATNALGETYANGQEIIDLIINNVLADVGSDNNTLVSQQIRKSMKAKNFVKFDMPDIGTGDFAVEKAAVDRLKNAKKQAKLKSITELPQANLDKLKESLQASMPYLTPEMIDALIEAI